MKHYVSILTVLVLSQYLSLSAFAANETGNAGDVYAMDFSTIGYEVVALLKNEPVSGVDPDALMQSVILTELHSEERLTLNGYEVNAINYPSNQHPKILISRTGWDHLARDRYEKVMLVFHEYLGILGKDDTNFQISHRLAQAGVCTRSSGVRKGIVTLFHGIDCDRLLIRDLAKVTDLELSNYPLDELKPGDFEFFGWVGILSLEGSLKSIKTGAFSGLDSLGSLIMIKVTGLNEIYRGAFQGLGRLSVVFLPPGLQWFEPGTFRNFSSSNLSLGINFNRYQEVPKDLFEGITLRRDSSKAKPCLTLIGQGGKKLYPEVLKPFLKIDRMVFKLQVDSDEERSDLEEFIEKLRPFVEDCSIDEKSDVFAWVCQFKRS